MKKIITSISIIVLAFVLCGNIFIKRDIKDYKAQIYYVDHSMLRLIPVDVNFEKTTTKDAASKMLEMLIEGKDNNPKILRVIPPEKKCMNVKIKNKTAIVNIKDSFMEKKPENKVHGLLAVYSIVNSLTSIEGIDTVKFTFEDRVEKGFVSGLDMRETFIPDYYL